MELRNYVKDLIGEYSLIPENSVVVLGLSGGPDSVCLFYLLNSLKGELGFELVCAHVNHGLRGEESDSDEGYVRELCKENGVPLEVVVLGAGELEDKKGLTVEEAARIVRYDFFEDVCAKYGRVAVIAVAHNSDDNAETVMMRILRGTGVDGLSGIPLRRVSERGTDIVRPLLRTDRTSIEQYLSNLGITAKIDSTNLEKDYGRNKIRLAVLPMLDREFSYQPGTAKKQLGRLSANAATDKDYFDVLTDGLIAEHFTLDNRLPRFARNDGDRDCTNEASLCVKVKVDFLVSLHPAVRHRLIVKAFSLVGLKQDIEAVHIRAIERLLEDSGTGKSVNLPHGFGFAISYDDAVFLVPEGGLRVGARNDSTDGARGGGDFEVSLYEIASLCDGESVEYLGFSFSMVGTQGRPPRRPLADTPPKKGNKDGNTEGDLLLDFDLLKAKADFLLIRSRRDGDRIAPTGMSGTKKIQDLFVDLKVDRHERDTILLLATPTEVLWVPEKRKSRSFAPTQETTSLLAVSLV
ncbi:MAG: tRNA lysidine(34) synthetase TilS [Clostridiales Family XIII bacterium]|jgi:tRNA(Ile)-lysidine synthase|nr:tRNA lysidine(34) synthetase TilS [Clostridiales Family XIII bacterium]